MRDPTLALVPIHDASCCIPRTREQHPGLRNAAAALAAFAALAVTVPASGLCLIGSIIIAITVVGWNTRTAAGASAISPAEIESPELAASYRALLASHAELARVIAGDGAASPGSAALLDRSRDTVVLCGKLAAIASRGERYCALHPSEHAAADATAFRARASATSDAESAQLLESAAAAADRRAAAVVALRRSRDRTCAELEAARAALDALIAALLTRQLADDRALALAADSLPLRIDELEADTEARAA